MIIETTIWISSMISWAAIIIFSYLTFKNRNDDVLKIKLYGIEFLLMFLILLTPKKLNKRGKNIEKYLSFLSLPASP